jgi:hypothetical protein
VHRSTNNGATFTNISGTLPTIAARSVVVDNSTDEKLYVGMSIGVYTYSNSNPAWMIMTDNLPLVAINELDIQYSTSKLRVATYGRGIWETSLVTSGCLAPSGLTASGVTNTGATMNWLAVAGATNYTIEYKLASSSTWIVLSAATSALSYVFSGLSVGTTYDFRVRTNCGSTSSFYAVSQFTTTSPPPACISAFEPNETQATATPLALNTSVSAGISTATDIDFYSFTTTTFTNLSIELTNLPFDYDIYVVNSAGTQIGSGTNGGTNDELVTFTALAPGTYALRVIGYAGVFSTTQCYSLIVGAVVVSPCLVAGGQNSTSITGTSASVNWTAVSGAVGYSVQYRVSGASTWTYAGISTSPTRSLTGLAFNTLYEWQVRTRCASDSSAYSGTFTFTTLPNCPSTVGSTMSNPILVGQAPCALTPYTNTQTNTLANCFLNNYTGLNNQASPNVWYRFSLSSAATVQVGHCGSIMVDSYIHLLDSSGNHLFSNDDNGPLCSGYRASISASLAAGTYYVVSEGYGAGTGSITTTISTTSPCQTVLNLGVFLQGYYNGSAAMVPAMWNQGHIATPAVTNLDVDDIVVSLRNSTAPYAQVASVNARLKTNGTAVCTFPYLSGNYYIVVSHRHSLETWSAAPVSFASSPVSYQFQTSAAQAYGQNQKQVSPGVYALYTGELEKDGNVDLFDLTEVQNDAILFMGGYIATDINGDGNVDLLDTPMVEENANNFIFQLRP